MKYMGSKARFVKEIIPILLKNMKKLILGFLFLLNTLSFSQNINKI
jgi:hypothetical protein